MSLSTLDLNANEFTPVLTGCGFRSTAGIMLIDVLHVFRRRSHWAAKYVWTYNIHESLSILLVSQVGMNDSLAYMVPMLLLLFLLNLFVRRIMSSLFLERCSGPQVSQAIHTRLSRSLYNCELRVITCVPFPFEIDHSIKIFNLLLLNIKRHMWKKSSHLYTSTHPCSLTNTVYSWVDLLSQLWSQYPRV